MKFGFGFYLPHWAHPKWMREGVDRFGVARRSWRWLHGLIDVSVEARKKT